MENLYTTIVFQPREGKTAMPDCVWSQIKKKKPLYIKMHLWILLC